MSYDSLDLSKKIVFLVSGGRDSTAMTLLFYEQNIPADVILLFGDTRVSKPKARQTLKRLAEYTGYPLYTARYEGEEKPIRILKDAFRKIPEIIEEETFGKGKTLKNRFRCCDLLKKNPMRAYIKRFDRDSIIQVLGLKGSDGALHRKYRLRQLRDADTYYRLKYSGYLFYYPLRDSTEQDIADILERHGFADTEGSGCGICPFFLLADWDEKDPEASRRSKQFAKHIGVEPRASSVMDIRAFCGGIEHTTEQILEIEQELGE